MKLGWLLLVMFTTNIVLTVLQGSAFSESLGLTIGSNSPASQFYNINTDTGELSLKESEMERFSGKLNTTETGFLNAIDYNIGVWGLIKSFLRAIWSFLFAPVSFMTALQVPVQITLILGTIWGIMYLTTLLSVIWRFQL
jgi:hypothetical protein